LTGFFFEL